MLQISRSENSEADTLAKAAAKVSKAFHELELTEELVKPSIEEEEVMNKYPRLSRVDKTDSPVP